MKIKHTVLFAILALISLSLTAYRIAPNQTENTSKSFEVPADKGIIFFTGTYKEALAKAKKESKPIFMDVYAEWCGPCKWMSKNVFTDKDAAQFYNDNFINFKIDAERGEGPYIASKYKIRGYPTLLFINGDGETLHKVAGAHPAKSFIEVGEKVIAKAK